MSNQRVEGGDWVWRAGQKDVEPRKQPKKPPRNRRRRKNEEECLSLRKRFIFFLTMVGIFVTCFLYTLLQQENALKRFVFRFIDERRQRVMKKWTSIFLALALLAVFSLGCAGTSKDTKIKCPKCGAVFTIDEGLAEIQKKGY
jgi:hypothetical protein